MDLVKFSKSLTPVGEVDVNLLGGKGAGLVKMTQMGLNVPPGFIIPTIYSFKPEALSYLALESVELVHKHIANELGYAPGTFPLVSVRSGARVSMPGMMDTILNVGITSGTMPFWIGKLGERNALDNYRRLIQMYGQTVKGIAHKRFASALKETLASKYGQKSVPTSEGTMSVLHLTKLVDKFKTIYLTDVGQPFPDSLQDQLAGAIGAVFQSWNSERAQAYRKLNNIPNEWGTAVVVQAMVFGNLNQKSGSGVLFSRNATTGDKLVMGEFLPNAQGEEVVSGSATPYNLTQMCDWNQAAFDSLMATTHQLEQSLKDMVDIEFTVENGKVFILQVRAGKRSAPAAFKIAYDLVQEGVIDRATALKRVTAEQYKTLSKAVIDPAFTAAPIATGLAGSKGIATGKVWLTAEKASKNPGGILVSKETTPDDFSGMAASVGILTATGGITSHAAVVARGMDRACVVGCTGLTIGGGGFQVGNWDVLEGDVITIEGDTGRVWIGSVPLIGGVVPAYVTQMIHWGMPAGTLLKYDPKLGCLPESGEVHIDCSKLESPEAAVLLMNGLALRPTLSGVLSFAGAKSLFDDSKFLSVLGVKVASPINGKIVGALLSCTNPILVKNWVVVPGIPVGKTPFRTPTLVKNMQDFFECEGYFEQTPEFAAVCKSQGTMVSKLIGLMVGAGKKVMPIPDSQSLEQMALAVFGCI